MTENANGSSLFDLTGKTALVTGGANGLGRMIAEALLQAGARVVVTSRKADACERAEAEMSKYGACNAISADFSDPAAAEAFVDSFRSRHDPLDILINNAGKTWGAPLESFPDKAWPGVMTMNVQLPFKLTQLLLPLLETSATDNDPSRVINIGSVAGKIIEPLHAYSYSASKAAIHQLSRQLASELALRNITVNTIIPGYFPTSMTAHLQDSDGAPTGMLADHIPMRRFGRPDDIGGVAVFLASRASAYLTGSEIVVDGGISGCR